MTNLFSDGVRLLPVLMVSAMLLFGIKLVHVVAGVETLVTGAQAEEDVAALEESAVQGEVLDNAMGDGNVETAAETDVAAIDPDSPEAPALLTRGEVAVLQSLANRRAELDQRQRDLDMRERLLQATERRVSERISELKGIEARIEAHFVSREEANTAQIESLVKMYENMKPKDAARIFERLDMGVLLTVAQEMNPRKMAAVLARMDPVSAQELTVELATQDELPASLDDIPDLPEAADNPS